MKIWAKTKDFFEGKFLVVRRAGTIPAWAHFVLGARDPIAPRALRFYAQEARKEGFDPAYCNSILELADDFDRYRAAEGTGDPESPPHRKDYADIVNLMGGRSDEATVTLRRERFNQRKAS